MPPPADLRTNVAQLGSRLKQLAVEAVYWPVDWQKLDHEAVSALWWYFSYCNK